jgi:DnaJ-class molecular chaperone
MKWCPHCNGYGSSLKEETGRCTQCGGSALVPVAEPGQEGPRGHDPAGPEQQD